MVSIRKRTFVSLSNIIWAFYLSFSIISFTHSALATNGTEPEVLFRTKDNKEIKVPLSLATMSGTIKDMIDDVTVEMAIREGIPLDYDEPLLKAIVNSLREMQKREEAKQPLSFSALKKIVADSLVGSALDSPDGVLNFLMAVNSLNIPSLLRPAAALWVDKKTGYKAITPAGFKLALVKTKHELKHELKNIPTDLQLYFNDYIKFLEDPISLIKAGEPIFIADNIGDFANSGSSLFLVGGYSYISIFDLKSKSMMDSQIEVYGSGLLVSGDRLYAFSGNKILVIDIPNKKTIDSIELNHSAIYLAVSGNELYTAAHNSESISVIDLPSGRTVDTISLKFQPSALTASGSALYVAGEGSSIISVIDLPSRRIVGSIDVLPEIKDGKRYVQALAFSGKTLFAWTYRESTRYELWAIDAETKKILGRVEQVPEIVRRAYFTYFNIMFASDNELFLGSTGRRNSGEIAEISLVDFNYYRN